MGYVQPQAGRADVDGYAIAALVLGIASLVYLPLCLLLGPLAMIFGARARARIAASGGTLAGAGLARAGSILGKVTLAIGLLFIVAMLVSRPVNPMPAQVHVQIQSQAIQAHPQP